MASPVLPDLPREVMLLVNEGVYALYALRPRGDGAAYVLATTEGQFLLLSESGRILGAVARLAEVELGEPLTFPAVSDRVPTIKLNYAV